MPPRLLVPTLAIRLRLKHIALLACALVGRSAPVIAHDQWADGSEIPAWVSHYCCGVADAHRLTLKQIYHVEGGWRVEGYPHTIPDERVLPSEDGHMWLFYKAYPDGYQSTPLCFFIPQGSI